MLVGLGTLVVQGDKMQETIVFSGRDGSDIALRHVESIVSQQGRIYRLSYQDKPEERKGKAKKKEGPRSQQQMCTIECIPYKGTYHSPLVFPRPSPLLPDLASRFEF